MRFAKRKAAWETADLGQIRDVEFKDKDGDYDLRPSVYEIDEKQIVQAFAEHAATAPIDPPRSALGIDFSGVQFPLLRKPGGKRFALIREQHREVELDSQSDLEDMIATVCRDLSARRRDVPKSAVYKYVGGQLEAADHEWIDIAESVDAKDWLKRIAERSK